MIYDIYIYIYIPFLLIEKHFKKITFVLYFNYNTAILHMCQAHNPSQPSYLNTLSLLEKLQVMPLA